MFRKISATTAVLVLSVGALTACDSASDVNSQAENPAYNPTNPSYVGDKVDEVPEVDTIRARKGSGDYVNSLVTICDRGNRLYIRYGLKGDGIAVIPSDPTCAASK